MKTRVALVCFSCLLIGCDAMVTEGVVAAAGPAALPLLIPMALIMDRMEDTEKTIQPVRVTDASNRVLAGPSDPAQAEASFRVARSTITCRNSTTGSNFGASFEAKMKCNDGSAGSLTLGLSSRYRSAIFQISRPDGGSYRCNGRFEGDHKSGTVAPFGVSCQGAADIPLATGVVQMDARDDGTVGYTLRVNRAG